jgi:nitrile hydratase
VAPWAARAFAIVVGMYDRNHFTWSEWVDRFAAELAPPGHFHRPEAEVERLVGEAEDIETHYYEHWLAACEKLLLAKEVMTKAEFDRKVAALAPTDAGAARFAPGDEIVVRDQEPVGNAHLPLYVRGKRGVVERDLGCFAFPEAETKLQHLYSVRFRARELWGPEASSRDSLHFSLCEGYLVTA